MDITTALNRRKWWLILAVLLLLNLFRYWTRQHTARHAENFRFPVPPNFGQPDAAMQARIDALPDDQRTAIETRLKEDRDFIASVQNLPDADRNEKIQEHFAHNPPPFPPGFAPPPGVPGPNPPPAGGPGGPGGSNNGPESPGNGPGGPGDGGAPHIPPPDARRSMDQNLINSMKNPGAQP